ncbi:SDR family NAD(P)-dependent oxidoreductase [Rivibacter subsaxonicus]|uniref:NAD(P)-dependent dehydrogenase (Short-subunit alcohol dehydrogenase family) n=1 Tax=Rivibacter subsaxonicus TaxID=457575 RepID=A0A4Q7W189_9BURK|nr:SDR family NAD(P)-dependent oxidoreductase [Rivibacter subsaxonicus]RZU02289.1 NAD(P)-dependent dehydrogenase (short-subunit alcohol dehydrogenase family) [Rivibacter subsaxonicus]
MNQHLYLLTGASRGLGRALAQRLLRPGHELLCLSRGTDPTLAEAARAAGVVCEQWPADLADPVPVAARLEAWLRAIDPQRFASATLVNNAALLLAPGPLDRSEALQLSAALRVGLEAPALLSAAFLRATRDWPASKRVLNISSGLGRRAMAGSASYCAVKAGLDHLSRAQALDEALQPNGARIVSLAPGVIDTDMQVQLRGAGAEGFPEHDMFVQMHRGGQLSTPADTAARIVEWMESATFGAEVVADIRTV